VAKRGFTDGSRRAFVTLLALGLSLAIAGCGGGEIDKGEVALTIPVEGPGGPESTAEKRVLSQIYAQALRATGYQVKTVSTQNLDVTKFEALKSGQIAGYPEHLSTALYNDFEAEIDELPANVHAAYEQAKRDFEEAGLTAFPPTPFGIANAVGMLRRTAEQRGLKTDSDLKGKAEEMTIKAPTYCHLSQECLGGIELHYNTAFEAVSYEDGGSVVLLWWRPEPNFRYRVLENGESDASMLFTTDGRLAGKKSEFVVLEDDKHAFPAGNVVWVTSSEIVDEAGPDYEKAVVKAQKGLTLKTMRELNAEVELEGKPPAKVAAAYLKSIGFNA
jgi:osmoprotectant transport system substrate-binding protein